MLKKDGRAQRSCTYLWDEEKNKALPLCRSTSFSYNLSQNQRLNNAQNPLCCRYWLGAFAKPFAMLLHSSPFSFCFGRAFAFTTEFISLSFAIVSLFAFASTVFSLSPPCALHGCSRIVSKSKHCKSTKPQNHTSEASELAKPHGKDL